MTAFKEVWNELKVNGYRNKKAEASGFLKTWDEKHIWLTSLMGDILEIFTVLQKNFQRDSLLITDILTCCDAALRRLQLMEVLPYPGKLESFWKNGIEHLTEPERICHNNFVTTNRGNSLAIRNEVVQAASEFLERCLHTEQEEISEDIRQLLNINSLSVFVKAGISFVKCLFPCRFADDSCEHWSKIKDVEFIPEGNDIGSNLSVHLGMLVPITTGIAHTIFAAIMSLSPHSMQTERIVSHHNIVASSARVSMTDDTIISRIFIAAHYDPKAAVAYFLLQKNKETENQTLKLIAVNL